MAEPALTQEIVQSIIDQSFKDNFWYFLLTLAVSVVVTWAIAYFTSSAKKSAEIRAVTSHLKDLKEQQKELSNSLKAGEIDAISENIRSVMAQLEVTTKLSESIKHGVEHDHWRKKEVEVTQRSKLEDLFELMTAWDSFTFDVIRTSKMQMIDLVNSDKGDEKANSLLLIDNYHKKVLEYYQKARMFSNLYFPHLSSFLRDKFEASMDFYEAYAKEFDSLKLALSDSTVNTDDLYEAIATINEHAHIVELEKAYLSANSVIFNKISDAAKDISLFSNKNIK